MASSERTKDNADATADIADLSLQDADAEATKGGGTFNKVVRRSMRVVTNDVSAIASVASQAGKNVANDAGKAAGVADKVVPEISNNLP